ncbi:MAG: winged helix-turn-helix domain-containing protein [Rhodothermales bacterium]|nr:winged helix-turn-helix domain-containing protein [Rhodothermales bacterium]
MAGSNMHESADIRIEHAPFRLGTWLVYPTLNRMAGPDGEVAVEPRVLRVLEVLAARPGRVVSREALLEAVWADVVVTEDALTRAVSELRKLLGDDPKAPRYVETIRGRGYRLVAPVEPVEEDAPPLPTHAGDGVELAVPEAPSATAAPTGPRRPTSFAAGLLAALGLVAVLLWPASAPPAPPEAVPFTSFPGRERFPVLSPDGSRVAFTWRGPDGRTDLYVKQTNTADPLRLTSDDAYEAFPVWSPDGSTLAFVREDADGDAIYAVPALGGTARRLLQTTSWTFGWDWAPDGRTLVLAERAAPGGSFRLVLFDLDTRERRPLTAPEADHTSDVTPAFSPDGRTVAFVRKDRLGVQEIHLVPTAGGPPRRLTTGALRITGLDWTADGRHLVYASYQNGTFGLWRVGAAGGTPTWIPTRGERLYSPSLAAGRLVFEELWYEKNVWRIQLGTDAAEPPTEPLIVSTRWDCEAVYSPDGDRLVFTSSRSGHLELWLAEADGSNPVQLTRFEGPFVGNPRWAPDGRHVAFYATPDGYADLFVLDVEGGPPQRLTEAGSNNWAASFSRDGRWLYFGSDRSGRWEIWRMPAGGGAAEPVTTDGGLTGFETADGAALLYTKPGGRGIWRRPLAGGPEVQLVDGLDGGDWGNWWPTDGGLVFVERGEGGPFVVRYDFATGTRQRLAAIPNIASPSLTLSPDGRSVLYARVERSESDLMLVEGIR